MVGRGGEEGWRGGLGPGPGCAKLRREMRQGLGGCVPFVAEGPILPAPEVEEEPLVTGLLYSISFPEETVPSLASRG